jgi:hypothetical protein
LASTGRTALVGEVGKTGDGRSVDAVATTVEQGRRATFPPERKKGLAFATPLVSIPAVISLHRWLRLRIGPASELKEAYIYAIATRVKSVVAIR